MMPNSDLYDYLTRLLTVNQPAPNPQGRYTMPDVGLRMGNVGEPGITTRPRPTHRSSENEAMNKYELRNSPVRDPDALTPQYRNPNTGDMGTQPSDAQERQTMVTGTQNPYFRAPTGPNSHAIMEQNSMRALQDMQAPYTPPSRSTPQSYRQAEINSMNQMGQEQLGRGTGSSAPKSPTTGRVGAPSPAPTQPQTPSNQVYWLDRGDGSPLTPMGNQLPKNMSPGAQQGGGYIFGVDAPTKSLFGKNPKSDLSQYPSADVPVPPVRPDDLGDGHADGGMIKRASKVAREKATPCHSGIINMAVGGRTDHIPMNVLEGSYVLPADIVSGLGEGNTLAGSKILDNMFSSGPFGTKMPNFRASPNFPKAQPVKNPNVLQTGVTAAKGGTISGNSKPVPIIAAGGEYVVHPETVTKLGQGNMDAGHEYLDNFVKYVRAHTAKTLQNLPGPRKD